MFTNKINGKRYIGSSDNLRRRFIQYFNTNHLRFFFTSEKKKTSRPQY